MSLHLLQESVKTLPCFRYIFQSSRAELENVRQPLYGADDSDFSLGGGIPSGGYMLRPQSLGGHHSLPHRGVVKPRNCFFALSKAITESACGSTFLPTTRNEEKEQGFELYPGGGLNGT